LEPGESFVFSTGEAGNRPAVLAPRNYRFTLDAVEEIRGPNYVATRGQISVHEGDRLVTVLHPEKRMYPVQGMPTTEAAISNGVWRDLYVVIGDQQPNGGWTVRTYIKPFANWIWLGALLMALGAGISLMDRRWRVAVAQKRMRRPAAAAP